jgi:hypothetical protein
MASIISYINVMFGLVIGIAQGLTTLAAARAELRTVTPPLMIQAATT